jgi:hypothetical protein
MAHISLIAILYQNGDICRDAVDKPHSDYFMGIPTAALVSQELSIFGMSQGKKPNWVRCLYEEFHFWPEIKSPHLADKFPDDRARVRYIRPKAISLTARLGKTMSCMKRGPKAPEKERNEGLDEVPDQVWRPYMGIPAEDEGENSEDSALQKTSEDSGTNEERDEEEVQHEEQHVARHAEEKD